MTPTASRFERSGFCDRSSARPKGDHRGQSGSARKMRHVHQPGHDREKEREKGEADQRIEADQEAQAREAVAEKLVPDQQQQQQGKEDRAVLVSVALRE